MRKAMRYLILMIFPLLAGCNFTHYEYNKTTCTVAEIEPCGVHLKSCEDYAEYICVHDVKVVDKVRKTLGIAAEIGEALGD